VGREDLLAFAPDLIAFDHEVAFDSLIRFTQLPYRQTRSWEHMVSNATRYAWEAGHYECWQVPFSKLSEEADSWDILRRTVLGLLGNARAENAMEGRFQRRDWVFLSRKAPAYESLRALLMAHGGQLQPAWSAASQPSGGR